MRALRARTRLLCHQLVTCLCAHQGRAFVALVGELLACMLGRPIVCCSIGHCAEWALCGHKQAWLRLLLHCSHPHPLLSVLGNLQHALG